MNLEKKKLCNEEGIILLKMGNLGLCRHTSAARANEVHEETTESIASGGEEKKHVVYIIRRTNRPSNLS